MPSTPVIALVEPFWTGHPESQLKMFIGALLREPARRLLVLCPDPGAITTWMDATRPGDANRCFTAPFAFSRTLDGFPAFSLASWAKLHQALTGAERHFGFSVDKVFITWLDMFIHKDPASVANLMPRPWVGLYLFPSYLRTQSILSRVFPPKQRAVDRSFFTTPYCHGVAVLDEGLPRSLAAIASGQPVHCLPDVADTALPATMPPLVQSVVQKAAGRPIVGLLGILGRRKGTMAFLEAMCRMDPARYFFLLAGRLGPEERKTYGPEAARLDALLQQAALGGNNFIHLDTIENEETFNALAAACSVHYLAYEGHYHSSGILGKSAFFRKLVIVSDEGCMAERVRAFKLGVTIRPGSVAATRVAIHELCHGPSLPDRLTKAGFHDYTAIHNPDTLMDRLNQLLAEIP